MREFCIEAKLIYAKRRARGIKVKLIYANMRA